MVLFMVILSLVGIAVAMYALWRDSRVIEVDEPTNVSFAPSRPSHRMDIPGKYPALRTRHSRVIK